MREFKVVEQQWSIYQSTPSGQQKTVHVWAIDEIAAVSRCIISWPDHDRPVTFIVEKFNPNK